MVIIERTDEDIMRETIELFEKCKPYLDKGWGLHKTVCTVKGLASIGGTQAWFKRLRDYVISQGYELQKGQKPKY